MSWEFGKSHKPEHKPGTSGRCYETHPVLSLGNGKLMGGAASAPVHEADIYVVLQEGSRGNYTTDPWEAKPKMEVCFRIEDMHAPVNVPRFKKLVTWVCNQLQEGKRVHVGCIGGHGRTGLVFSAIIAEMNGEKDAIQWVRNNYCLRAVESREQVEFLRKHYGVSVVKGHKEGKFGDSIGFQSRSYEERDIPRLGKSHESYANYPSRVAVTQPQHKLVKDVRPEGVADGAQVFQPVSSARCIWGRKTYAH